MLSRLFSEQNINRFLEAGSFLTNENEPYSEQELKRIHAAIDKLYGEMTATVAPSTGKPTFVMAVGAPGSGKTTFLNELTQVSRGGEQFIHVDMDIIRENFDLFQEALSEQFQRGASSSEADDYAYCKYRNAAVFVARSVANRLFENGYNIAYASQPRPLVDNLKFLQGIIEGGYDLKMKIFHAQHGVLEESVHARSVATGRQIRLGYLDQEHSAIGKAIDTSMSAPIEMEFFWRTSADSAPVLVAKKDGEGSIKVENFYELECFLNELCRKEGDAWRDILQAWELERSHQSLVVDQNHTL